MAQLAATLAACLDGARDALEANDLLRVKAMLDRVWQSSRKAAVCHAIPESYSAMTVGVLMCRGTCGELKGLRVALGKSAAIAATKLSR
jgi:hypothetical protein